MASEIEGAKKVAEIVRDPSSYPLVTYLWVVLLSVWGGMVRYLNSIRNKQVPWRTMLMELFVGACTSSFVGVITFLLCEASAVQPLWTAVFVALTGHMGAEGLQIVRRVARARWNTEMRK